MEAEVGRPLDTVVHAAERVEDDLHEGAGVGAVAPVGRPDRGEHGEDDERDERAGPKPGRAG